LIKLQWSALGRLMEDKMASKKKGPVELIALQCSECKRRNYTTEKNRRNTQEKLELKKYCPFDRKHTLHKETKVK
jgi:large subunit ribosomal protein L33